MRRRQQAVGRREERAARECTQAGRALSRISMSAPLSRRHWTPSAESATAAAWSGVPTSCTVEQQPEEQRQRRSQ